MYVYNKFSKPNWPKVLNEMVVGTCRRDANVAMDVWSEENGQS